jgi:hypothetical protein
MLAKMESTPRQTQTSPHQHLTSTTPPHHCQNSTPPEQLSENRDSSITKTLAPPLEIAHNAHIQGLDPLLLAKPHQTSSPSKQNPTKPPSKPASETTPEPHLQSHTATTTEGQKPSAGASPYTHVWPESNPTKSKPNNQKRKKQIQKTRSENENVKQEQRTKINTENRNEEEEQHNRNNTE